MMDHHGPTVRLPTKIPRLVVLVHLFVAALLTVESSSSFLSALLLIPADSQRPAPISSRPPSSDEAVANSIDASDDECESFYIPPVRRPSLSAFCYTLSLSSSSSRVTGHIAAGCVGLLKATGQEMRVHFPFHPLASEWAASSAGCVPLMKMIQQLRL